MKPSKIADKIIISMYRRFLSSGDEFSHTEKIVQQFPDEPTHQIHAAIRMLSKDDLLSVLFAEDEPTEIALNVSAIQQCDENTLLKKGYEFFKEIRSLR